MFHRTAVILTNAAFTAVSGPAAGPALSQVGGHAGSGLLQGEKNGIKLETHKPMERECR